MRFQKSFAQVNFRVVFFLFLVCFFFGGFVLLVLRLHEPEADLFRQTIQTTLLVACLAILLLIKFVTFDRWIFLLTLLSLSTTFFMITQTQVLNTDRSRSFYILSWVDSEVIQEKDGLLSFNADCSKEMLNPEAISIRLEEQIDRGFVRRDPELKLTYLGAIQLGISEQLARFYNLRNWSQNTC